MTSQNRTAPIEQPDAPVFGASAAMRRVLEDVSRAAKTSSNVVISGEPGTGRELVAREIHRLADAVERPFIKVAYAADAADAFELDLFGSPASRTSDKPERRALERIGRSGHLYQALGGTIFFANLPEMPGRLQIRLARLLRDGEAVTLHGKSRVKLTVRAVAAVEQGYREAVSDGRINEELFQLLSAVRIDLPPLRRRGEDIPALAAYLLNEACREAGVASKQLTSAAQQLLRALPWHGNAVELQRLLTELVQRLPGDVIDLTDVLATVQIDGRAKPFAKGGTLREARARFEREYIAAVMAQHHGRIPEAAKTLGVQRPNLYRKLRRLNVPKTARRNSTDY
jgi:two-component system nitrogen regulation response regulator GlnG